MNQGTRQTAIDLLLVFVVALLPQLQQSLYFFFRGTDLFGGDANIYLQCAYLLPSFLIVWYVMRVRGQTPAYIGVYEDPYDLFTGVILAVSSLLVYSLFCAIVNGVLQKESQPTQAPSSYAGISFPGLMLFAIVSAVREELVIRGFVMRSVFSLTGNQVATVLAPSCIDFLLFLPYGVLPCLSYVIGRLVLSLYFLRTGKLIPVVVAHIVLNLVFVAQV